MAKTVDRPDYPEFEDTPYITQSRDLQDLSYGYTKNALDNFNSFINPEQYQAVADAYTQAQWNDLNRNYQRAINQNAARERQRLGTSGASSSLYNTESLNQQYNDLASRVSAQTAAQYQNLINNEYNRRLSTLTNNANLWSGTGTTNYNHDYNNYKTRIQNMYNDWLDEVDAKQAKNQMISGAINGISSIGGSIAGGIFGGFRGSMMGGQMGAQQGQMVSNALGLGYNQLGRGYNNTTPYSTFSQNQNWLSNSGVGNYGLGMPTQSSLMDTMNNSSLYKAWQSRGLI